MKVAWEGPMYTRNNFCTLKSVGTGPKAHSVGLKANKIPRIEWRACAPHIPVH